MGLATELLGKGWGRGHLNTGSVVFLKHLEHVSVRKAPC